MSSSVALHLTLLRESSLSKKLAVKGRLTGQKALGSICLHLRCRDHGYTAMLGFWVAGTRPRLVFYPGAADPCSDLHTLRDSHLTH